MSLCRDNFPIYGQKYNINKIRTCFILLILVLIVLNQPYIEEVVITLAGAPAALIMHKKEGNYLTRSQEDR